ncbi:hypothetical protein HAX54_046705 [Datura stramonium]|uniref:Uncharacterized protein n=1 Tax=Datura stramonium TaxID=4076 RepID=A0ABS8SRU9_DATST|nr:hypothetical protein [Datura stramonium]
MAALRAASRAIQSGSFGGTKKKKEEVLTVAPYYQHGDPSTPPNHGNQGVTMITLDEEYDTKGTIFLVGNTEEVSTTSSVAPFITVQLRAPLTIHTYHPRSIVTTAIAKKLDYNSQAVPWDYEAEAKAKMINTAIAHRMTRSGRCYVPDNLNKPALGREQNQKRNVTDAEIVEF